MPDNLTTVQVLTVPHSKFNLGDLVAYTFKSQNSGISYFGKIVGRICTNNISDIFYWEYEVEVSIIFRDGILFDSEDIDFILESYLVPWNGFKKDCFTIFNYKIFQHR